MSDVGGLTLNERLGRIEGAVDALRQGLARLEAMASRYSPEDAQRFRAWQHSVDARLGALEQADAVDRAVVSFRRWQIGQTLALITALAAAAAALWVHR